MNAKEEVIKMIEKLPVNVTLEDIIKGISVKAKIEKGLDQLNEGEYYSHEEVKGKFAKWLN
jgi:predicted transcriptional regulator